MFFSSYFMGSANFLHYHFSIIKFSSKKDSLKKKRRKKKKGFGWHLRQKTRGMISKPEAYFSCFPWGFTRNKDSFLFGFVWELDPRKSKELGYLWGPSLSPRGSVCRISWLNSHELAEVRAQRWSCQVSAEVAEYTCSFLARIQDHLILHWES